MSPLSTTCLTSLVLLACATAACSSKSADGGGQPASNSNSGTGGSNASGGAASTADGGSAGSVSDPGNPLSDPESGPPAGNPQPVAGEAPCDIPADAAQEDITSPTTVVGTGTQDSCTADAFIQAVEQGGVIVFDCGDEPTTIFLDRPAKIRNDSSDKIVIDGGGLVTLSGRGQNRILYMNTCDEAQVWTTSHCNNQEFPQLSVQNLTFIDGNAKDAPEEDGGGAIFASGGRFKVINSRFFNNVCDDVGPDVGGAAIRVMQQYEDLPAYVVGSTFGGSPQLGNVCSNGGGISSIGVNWQVINSLFSHNRAIGEGANPAQDGKPGGGSGGAIYNDGRTLHLKICGSRIEDNTVNEHGSAIFFISNNHEGTLEIENSIISGNHGGSWYQLPGVSMHPDTAQIIDSISILED